VTILLLLLPLHAPARATRTQSGRLESLPWFASLPSLHTQQMHRQVLTWQGHEDNCQTESPATELRLLRGCTVQGQLFLSFSRRPQRDGVALITAPYS